MTKGSSWRATRVRLAVAVALALAGGAAPIPAQPVEHRLKVVSVHESAFLSFLRAGETGEGASGPGLDALAARLDAGDFPRAGLLLDRPLRPAGKDVAPAWAAPPLRVEVKRGGGLGDPWDEVRWEGVPGQHTVWLVEPGHRQPQDLRRVALGAAGSLRHHLPHAAGWSSPPLAVASMALALVRSLEQRAVAWPRVSPILDLQQGIACIVAISEDGVWPDRVRLIASAGDRPVNAVAVLAWRMRGPDRENPSYR